MRKENRRNVTSKITRNEMLDAISRSGYLMEQRVFPKIEREGFHVTANPVYPDPDTKKTREYDFSAIAAEKLYQGAFDFLFMSIVGECLNNAQPLVFFTSQTPISYFVHHHIKAAGIPLYIPDAEGRGRDMSLQEYLHFEKFHHYFRGTFSSQYCSFKLKSGKGPEWMAWHDEEHHGLFNSLIEATKFEVADMFSSRRLRSRDKREPVNVNLFYPLLIVRHELYECRQTRNGVVPRKRNHVHFIKSVMSGTDTDVFHIDVITEWYLGRYLSALLREAKEMKQQFQRKKKMIQISVDKIVARAHSARAKKRLKDLREILEYRG